MIIYHDSGKIFFRGAMRKLLVVGLLLALVSCRSAYKNTILSSAGVKLTHDDSIGSD